MIKIIVTIVIITFAFSLKLNAQVGINTDVPNSTMDIVAKNTTGASSNVDGLLVPRVDRQRAQSMTGVSASTLIYVNSIATGTASGTAVNITDTGYYYFNDNVWVKLNTGTSIFSLSVDSTTGADFNVNDLATTIVPGTSQSVTIPAEGKALFINFMLGIDFVGTAPAGSGVGFYESRLYIDGTATDAFLRVQEYGQGALSTQFTLNTVKSLAAGPHTLDIRMTRTSNNGTTSGANMNCRPISMSFNASYIK
ncbi:hypothetical protein ODZ84_01475 [Chryseobacterium fluminis]|uniref:hypothetical protein n=1 Tax=Chryseobacterium fluminis TaxID=2983606 RepID=UPI0022591203|nr:hypothetical protein [Chryseobacterium sp. MMS21-Ot14]UZT98268.1 hypothetical protein ODZ84_01475 [Chryseobacterium sp. MMS21-Ot14]